MGDDAPAPFWQCATFTDPGRMLCAGVLQFPDLVQRHQALFSLAALRVLMP